MLKMNQFRPEVLDVLAKELIKARILIMRFEASRARQVVDHPPDRDALHLFQAQRVFGLARGAYPTEDFDGVAARYKGPRNRLGVCLYTTARLRRIPGCNLQDPHNRYGLPV